MTDILNIKEITNATISGKMAIECILKLQLQEGFLFSCVWEDFMPQIMDMVRCKM
jgi:hypothetical protein